MHFIVSELVVFIFNLSATLYRRQWHYFSFVKPRSLPWEWEVLQNWGHLAEAPRNSWLHAWVCLSWKWQRGVDLQTCGWVCTNSWLAWLPHLLSERSTRMNSFSRSRWLLHCCLGFRSCKSFNVNVSRPRFNLVSQLNAATTTMQPLLTSWGRLGRDHTKAGWCWTAHVLEREMDELHAPQGVRRLFTPVHLFQRT